MMFKDDAVTLGMVIHCPEKEEAGALRGYLESIGYVDIDFMDGAWERYKADTCFIVKKSPNNGERTTFYGSYNHYLSSGYTITEFSDLLTHEQRFKVGDKVRVRPDLVLNGRYGELALLGDMAKLRGTSHIVTEVTSLGNYRLSGDPNGLYWADEMLELMENSHEMSAVEVLGWLMTMPNETLDYVFGYDSLDEIFRNKDVNGIIEAIIAYEAAKKAPKPIEVEFLIISRIYEWQGDKWEEVKRVEHIVDGDGEDEYEIAKQDLLDYRQSPQWRHECYVESERRCRVKESEQDG